MTETRKLAAILVADIGKKSAEGQREMSLPISGGGKVQKKPAARAPATKQKAG